MGAWTRPGPNGSLVLVPPRECPNGHPLRGQVTIGSDVSKAWYLCHQCGACINRLHDERVEWVTQDQPAAF